MPRSAADIILGSIPAYQRSVENKSTRKREGFQHAIKGLGALTNSLDEFKLSRDKKKIDEALSAAVMGGGEAFENIRTAVKSLFPELGTKGREYAHKKLSELSDEEARTLEQEYAEKRDARAGAAENRAAEMHPFGVQKAGADLKVSRQRAEEN